MLATNLPFIPPEAPLVSVIMPAYQCEAFVLKGVQSVLNQTYPHLELIVVDDGSTDGTLQKLSQIEDPRLRVLSQPNRGASQARNLGFSEARGEFIAFLDADDLWFPDYLETALVTLYRSPDPKGMAYSWYYAVDDQNRLMHLSPGYQHTGLQFETLLYTEGMLIPSTTVIHRAVFEKTGGFPTQVVYNEDRVFFTRAAQTFPIYPMGKRLVVYRQSLSGKCRSILKNFEAALSSELHIVNVLNPLLTPTQVLKLRKTQLRNLCVRLLMYDFMASAKRLQNQIEFRMLLQDKKGLLALMSLLAGVNLVSRSRVVFQWLVRHGLAWWWRWKSAPLYRMVTNLEGLNNVC